MTQLPQLFNPTTALSLDIATDQKLSNSIPCYTQVDYVVCTAHNMLATKREQPSY